MYTPKTVAMLCVCVPLLNMRGKICKLKFGPSKHITHGWMNGCMDGWICFKTFLGEVPEVLRFRHLEWFTASSTLHLFTSGKQTRQGPAIGSLFLRSTLLESIHVLLQKVHGLETVCGKLKKKNATNLCGLPTRDAVPFWGKERSRSEMSMSCFIRDIMFVSASMRILKTVFH